MNGPAAKARGAFLCAGNTAGGRARNGSNTKQGLDNKFVLWETGATIQERIRDFYEDDFC